jgi:hypothetical protein
MSVVVAASPFSVEALVAKTLEMIGADVPTAVSLLQIAAKLAQLVNKAPNMHGPEKSALVQNVLREILNSPAVRPKLDAETVDKLNVVIDTVVPTALTLIISAGRGEFDLKKLSDPKKVWSWCCRSVAVHIETAVKEPVSEVAPASVSEVVPVVAVAPAPVPEVVVAPVPVPEVVPVVAVAPAPVPEVVPVVAVAPAPVPEAAIVASTLPIESSIPVAPVEPSSN